MSGMPTMTCRPPAILSPLKGRLRGVAFWLVVCLVTVALPGFAAEAPPAVVLFNTPDEPAMREAISDIAKAGGVVRHSFPPHVAIVDLPRGAEAAFAGDSRIDLIARGAVDAASLSGRYGKAASDAVAAWNAEYIYPSPSPAAPPVEARPLIGDARVSPRGVLSGRPGAAALTPAPPGADQWQTSEYLMGSTTISLILLESTGAENTENWTADETTQITSETLRAANYWISMYPYTAAPLSFTWEYHYAVPTSVEPINHSSVQDYLWVIDALNALGYPSTPSIYWDQLYAYLNDIRDAHGTDWAYAVFVVDSSHDSATDTVTPGTFTDGYFAYAYVNGPMVQMTYDNDGYGITFMGDVLAHETGHIFGAADEYCQPGYSCCDSIEYYGYLRIQNTNCGTNPDCVMNNNSAAICDVSRRQLGWRDSDLDSIPDILDVAPTASLNAYPEDPTPDITPTFTGSAGVGYFPNQNEWYSPNPGEYGPDVTLNRIAGVQYRINSGAWQNASAVDGAFDEPTEAYTFTTAPLLDGTYTFEVRTLDSSGNSTGTPYPSDTLTIFGHVNVTVLADPLVIPSAGTTQLTGSATDENGHNIVSYEWDDGGAGGVFLPSATITGPAYTAAANTSGSDRVINLALSATCDGIPPTTGTNAITITVKFDFDGDGMADWWEQQWGLDQLSPADASLDNDGDGLTNLQEYQNLTNPGSSDTDADGMPDNWEVQHALDPNSAADASIDTDHDGLTALQEYQAGTDPADRDTDNDGFGDAEEVTLDSNPLVATSKPDHGHFSDVAPTGFGTGGTDPFWAFHEIEACFRAGIVSGFLDGSYQPGLSVSRDQMAVYIARAIAGGDANVPRDHIVASFTDVPTDYWAFHYIEYTAEFNVVRGYPEGDYKPSLPVDRGTMAVYIARAIAPFAERPDLPSYQRPVIPTFTDVPTQYWSYKYVEYCVDRGVVQGFADGLYHPERVVTRDQMAVYITRAFELPA